MRPHHEALLLSDLEEVKAEIQQRETERVKSNGFIYANIMRGQILELEGRYRALQAEAEGRQRGLQALQAALDDKAALIELVERLRTQDNRWTAEPVFLVQSKESHGGMEPECADAVCWIDVDGDVASAEEHERFEKLHEDGDEEEELDGWTRTGVVSHWVTVQWFLTEASAQEYIERNGHRHGRNGDGELRIYADSAYRNPELQLLRRVLPLIVEGWKTEHGEEINNPS